MSFQIDSYIIHLFETITILSIADPVDCTWSEWEEWSTCGATCGIGSKTRHRMKSTEAANGGADCSGEAQMTMSCNAGECPGTSSFFYKIYVSYQF